MGEFLKDYNSVHAYDIKKLAHTKSTFKPSFLRTRLTYVGRVTGYIFMLRTVPVAPRTYVPCFMSAARMIM
jgi:hypothetical protein